MRTLFEHTRTKWTRFTDYEWKTADNGICYLVPTKDAKDECYNPMEHPEEMICKALDIGLLCYLGRSDDEIKAAIRGFACQYGLLGIMTALPATAKFIEYGRVYLPKNELIRAEEMDSIEYLDMFFPFEKPAFMKDGDVNRWKRLSAYSVGFIDSYKGHTEATALSFTRIYGERYDWLKAIFKSWSFTFMTSYLYCHDEDGLDDDCERLYEKGIAAFDGNAPTYHIELKGKPLLVWDFHSLLLCIELLFSIMLTDDATPLRMCKNCQRAFIAKGMDDEFCSKACREKLDLL